MTSPSAIHEVVIAPVSAEHPRNTEAATIELSDGRLLLAWSEFSGGHSDWASAQISGRHSDDGGRTWGEKLTIVPNAGQVNTMSPSLVRLQSGQLGLTYSVCDSPADSRVYWRRSDDEGHTWSDPVRVTAEVAYHIVVNDCSIQLQNGRIIVPIQTTPTCDDEATYAVFSCFSDDDGDTWQRSTSEIALPKRGAMEPTVVERQDGSVLMVIRTQLGDQYRAESADRGETWAEVRPLGVVGSEAPAGLKRIPSTGDLLLVWNHGVDPTQSHLGRSRLTAAISRDDGETWEHFHDLEHEPGYSFSYPSILFRGDEVALTYWSREGTGPLALKLKIVPVGWFYA